jgi:hypothetical protein
MTFLKCFAKAAKFKLAISIYYKDIGQLWIVLFQLLGKAKETGHYLLQEALKLKEKHAVNSN